VPSCSITLTGDMNEDGSVDFRDLVEAVESGDLANVRRVIDAML